MATTFGIEIKDPQVEMFVPEEYGHDMWLVNAYPDELAADLSKQGIPLQLIDEADDVMDWAERDNLQVEELARLVIACYQYALDNDMDLRASLTHVYEQLTNE